MRAAIAFVLALVPVLHAAGQAGSLSTSVPKPGSGDLCPICGMLVAKYPNWTATIVWKDGKAHHFDGAKDMFKFLQALSKYAPGRSLSDIQSIAVKDYYSLTHRDARNAWFVIGSDVMGPMGNELVPLATREDATDFLKDHRGKRILTFQQVTPEIIAQLDGRP
jgi:copper chaperone NosL